jgi:hypothetical protein
VYPGVSVLRDDFVALIDRGDPFDKKSALAISDIADEKALDVSDF